MGGEGPAEAESNEDEEDDDDSPLEAFLLRLALFAFLFDDPVSFCRGDRRISFKFSRSITSC